MLKQLKKVIKSNPLLFSKSKCILLYLRYLCSVFSVDKYNNLKEYIPISIFQVKEKRHHCFFGYYDKSPMNPQESHLAYLKVRNGFNPGEKAEVCVLNIKSNKSFCVGTTTTWNWQQGCMLQWINDCELSYNDYDKDKHIYISIIINIKTGNKIINNRAVYSYNSDFSKYLSLNFYRLDIFAKGYGYPYNVDSLDSLKDGIWECKTGGKSELLISLGRIIDYDVHYEKNIQHYVNHVTYCPNENNILFIHRWQEQGTTFTSRLLLYDILNDKLTTILDNGHVSHYCWHSEKELLIYATDSNGNKGYHIVNIYNGRSKVFEGLPSEDGHPSYSNDMNIVLTDSYPNNRRKQHLFIYNISNEELMILDVLKTPFKYYNDERCDLHPRWSFSNKYIMVDNTSNGLRSIKVYNVK